MLVAQWSRPVPGRLSQHSRLLPLQLRGYARNSIGSWWTFVRRYWRVPDGQWRLFSLVSQHARHCLLRLSRRLHVGRWLENVWRSVVYVCWLFYIFFYSFLICQFHFLFVFNLKISTNVITVQMMMIRIDYVLAFAAIVSDPMCAWIRMKNQFFVHLDMMMKMKMAIAMVTIVFTTQLITFWTAES